MESNTLKITVVPEYLKDDWTNISDCLPPEDTWVFLKCSYMMYDYITIGTISNGNRGETICDKDIFYRSAVLAWKPLSKKE